MRDAVDATKVGFEAVIADLPRAIEEGRGERWVEGVFGLHARHQGNGVGYDSICAAGDHANTLHWIKNTGDIDEDDLILLDAGVELDSLFTADITRTLPASALSTQRESTMRSTPLSRRLAAVKPGTSSATSTPPRSVIAEHLHAWGLLPEVPSRTPDTEHGQYHRRWMVHGEPPPRDRRPRLRSGDPRHTWTPTQPGMILTVSRSVLQVRRPSPERFAASGCIEDGVLVTEDGHENLGPAEPLRGRRGLDRAGPVPLTGRGISRGR